MLNCGRPSLNTPRTFLPLFAIILCVHMYSYPVEVALTFLVTYYACVDRDQQFRFYHWILKYFSLTHKWHTFVTWLKGLALLTIFQLTSYPIFWSCSFQMCFDNVVEFLGFLVLKLDSWFLNLSVKGGSESPMYVSTLSSFVVTVAGYITQDIYRIVCICIYI